MDRRPGMPRLLEAVVLALGVVAVASFMVVALLRIGYPFQLEWMEAGAVHSIERVLGEGALYDEPTLEYVPFIYPPLYFYLSAGVASVIGVDLTTLRLVSLLAAVGCFLVLFLLVRRETGSAKWGFVSASLFAATYELSGSWFDLARVDTLFLFFMLAAVWLLRGKPTPGVRVAAGLLLALSCLTKQSALIVAATLLIHATIFEGRRATGLVAATLGALALSTAALQWIYGDWYLFYLWLPGGHGVVGPAWLTFWSRDLGWGLPAAVAFAAWALFRRAREWQPSRLFYVALSVGMLTVSWVSRLHVGGYANVLMPAHALLCLLAGLGGAAAVESIRSSSLTRRRLAESLVYAAVSFQFAWLSYDPRGMLPSRADREAGEGLVRRLSTIEGNLLVPFHAYLGRRAGGGDWLLGNVGGDLLRADTGDVGRAYAESLRRAIRERSFAAIVIDGSAIDRWSDFLPTVQEELERAYKLGGRVFASEEVFWPVTGARTRPQYVFVPRDSDG